MEYNKSKFLKSNDKKILHKVKKQWVIISMAMLSLLGGGAVVYSTSAHADIANQSNTTLKDRLNQNLQQTDRGTQTVHSQNQLINNHTYQKLTNDGQQATDVINRQANALHNRIIANVTVASQLNITSARNRTTQNNESQSNTMIKIAQQPKLTNVGQSNNSRIEPAYQHQVGDINDVMDSAILLVS